MRLPEDVVEPKDGSIRYWRMPHSMKVVCGLRTASRSGKRVVNRSRHHEVEWLSTTQVKVTRCRVGYEGDFDGDFVR